MRGTQITQHYLALCTLYYHNRLEGRRYDSQRRKSLKVLLRRPPGNLSEEYAVVMQRSSVPRDDVQRLWTGVATFYDVPADRLRASDLLKGDLAGVTGHIDYDPFFCSLILGHKGPARDVLEGVVDWGDLIACLYQFEQESGRLGTKTVERNGVPRCVWDGEGTAIATNHCQTCGYNLTGNTSGRCPECGAPTKPVTSLSWERDRAGFTRRQ